ncbi:MAG TPA: hypothetical protein VF580_04025 [Thermoanaerobaculia bacterium]
MIFGWSAADGGDGLKRPGRFDQRVAEILDCRVPDLVLIIEGNHDAAAGGEEGPEGGGVPSGGLERLAAPRVVRPAAPRRDRTALRAEVERRKAARDARDIEILEQRRKEQAGEPMLGLKDLDRRLRLGK